MLHSDLSLGSEQPVLHNDLSLGSVHSGPVHVVVQLHVDVLLVGRLEGWRALAVVVEVPGGGRVRPGRQHGLPPRALLVLLHVVVLQLLGGHVFGRPATAPSSSSTSPALVGVEERVAVAAEVFLVLVVGLLVAEVQLLQVFAVRGLLPVVPDDEEHDAQDAQGAHHGTHQGNHVALACKHRQGQRDFSTRAGSLLTEHTKGITWP